MELNLKDKVVIVTGGSRGIGASIVRSFAAEGAIVIIFDRNEAEGRALAEALCREGGRVSFVTIELTSEASLKEAIEQTLATQGGIDVVVNNAGVNDGAGLDAGLEAFRASLERNLVPSYAMIHYTLEALKKSKGCIVNIGSKVAETGQGGTSAYAAAKGGIAALTREWALELAPWGVRSNAVIPAEVMTPQYREWLETQPEPEADLKRIQDSIPLGRRMTRAEEIADAVVFLASSRSAHTTGQLLHVDGGYTHLDRRCTAT